MRKKQQDELTELFEELEKKKRKKKTSTVCKKSSIVRFFKNIHSSNLFILLKEIW